MALPTPLINRTRAETVLARRDTSALVLTDPMSIYQATGFWPQTVAMGQCGVAYAVVPRDPAQPVKLITSQFIHYLFDIDEMPKQAGLEVFLYTSPAGLEGEASAPIFLAAAPGGQPDPMDQISQTSTTGALSRRPAFPDAATALRAALASLPDAATLGVDSFIPQSLFGDAFRYRPADPMLRHIRMIKTPAEIALMRYAARNNAEAAQTAILSMKPGDTYQDLRSAFFAETGRRGGVPLFISTDSMAMRQRDGILREGRSFQIDAVSHYAGYHGDYGRTVFVGKPDPIIRRMVDAAVCANDAIAGALRPGLLYSDIRRIGQEAVAKAGYDVLIPCACHSVGLFHTDEAFKDDALNFTKDDHLIEKDMVLSVDCPVLHLDASGNVHLEDLWLITENGCEPLNDRSDPFIQISA